MRRAAAATGVVPPGAAALAGRVPLVGVTGTHGRNPVAKLVAHLLYLSGQTPIDPATGAIGRAGSPAALTQPV